MAKAKVNLWQLSLIRQSLADAKIAADAAKEGAEAAKSSAETARQSIIASDRAWLRVDVTTADDEGIRLNKDGAVLPITFKIKNVGNAPAIKVTWNAWLVNITDMLQEQSLRCNQIRERPWGIGPTIFPNDQYPSEGSSFSFGAGTDWDALNKASYISRMPIRPGRIVSLGLVGCIDYTFPTDSNTHHQTSFAFMIGHPIPIPNIAEQATANKIIAVTLIASDLTLDPGAD